MIQFRIGIRPSGIRKGQFNPRTSSHRNLESSSGTAGGMAHEPPIPLSSSNRSQNLQAGRMWASPRSSTPFPGDPTWPGSRANQGRPRYVLLYRPSLTSFWAVPSTPLRYFCLLLNCAVLVSEGSVGRESWTSLDPWSKLTTCSCLQLVRCNPNSSHPPSQVSVDV